MLIRYSLIIALVLLFSGCHQSNNKVEKPVVIVSISPQKFFVEQIADTLIHVEVMVKPGSSPETYEPTASQLKLLNLAKVYFSLGLLDFEKTMLKNIEKQNPELNVINHSKDLSLLEGVCNEHNHNHSHIHGHDPHVWTSPAEVKTIIKSIVNVLSETYPQYSSQFMVNYQSFVADLDSLDGYIKHTLSDTKTREFYIFHPALNYFARDYNLTQVALEEEGKAPSMKHFKSVIQNAKDQGVLTIFIQREFDVNTARTAAADIGGRVVVIDPLDEQWLDNMYLITNQLKEALNGN
jgi:zinc transport system substrate-binding protein